MSRSLSRLQALVLGGVVLAVLMLGGIGLFAVGSRQWPWNDSFEVRAGFKQVRGVEVGTRVRVQGVDAGEVIALQPPEKPGGDVRLTLRLAGHWRREGVLRADATARIVSEGMVGGKVIELDPGTEQAGPVEPGALLASRESAELTDVLNQVGSTLQDIRDGEGSLGKLVKDPEAYLALLALLQQGHETMKSFQQDADAIKRLPLVRGYVEDPEALLIRPDCERNRQVFAEEELFEPGRAVLTAQGRKRLDDLAPWLAGLKHKGSEVVVVAYADPMIHKAAAPARLLTRQQSEAVCEYLKQNHAIQKMGWFSSRKVTPLGLGTSPPPLPEKDRLPAGRVEVLVFVPQS